MYTYLASIPSAAVRREVDGNLYAFTYLTIGNLPDGRITVIDGKRPRMLRVHSINESNGTAELMLGRAGDAIANTVNLPFAVTASHE